MKNWKSFPELCKSSWVIKPGIPLQHNQNSDWILLLLGFGKPLSGPWSQHSSLSGAQTRADRFTKASKPLLLFQQQLSFKHLENKPGLHAPIRPPISQPIVEVSLMMETLMPGNSERFYMEGLPFSALLQSCSPPCAGIQIILYAQGSKQPLWHAAPMDD